MATNNVKKKNTAQVNTKSGTQYSYKFTDLATIHEELEKQNVKYYQYTEYDERAQADYIYTALCIDGQKVEPIRGAKIIEGNTLAGGNAAQQYGSALTYARRYSLLMALGWATEDDDGASAGTTTTAPASHQTHPTHGDRLDFDQVKAWLEQLHTEDEVKAAKVKLLAKFPNMTEKQRSAIDRIFATRIDHLEYGDNPFDNK